MKRKRLERLKMLINKYLLGRQYPKHEFELVSLDEGDVLRLNKLGVINHLLSFSLHDQLGPTSWLSVLIADYFKSQTTTTKGIEECSLYREIRTKKIVRLLMVVEYVDPIKYNKYYYAYFAYLGKGKDHVSHALVLDFFTYFEYIEFNLDEK